MPSVYNNREFFNEGNSEYYSKRNGGGGEGFGFRRGDRRRRRFVRIKSKSYISVRDAREMPGGKPEGGKMNNARRATA